jgi:nitroimidazol reductase NimA-like FMN-containing flavoprotein (pyridoxamine 5'-phosphate oxidase superfamily)
MNRAKEIMEKILYITIATTNESGQPWNSPVYSAFDENYNFYWASWRNNQHSENIRQNSKVFLVIYDSTAPESTGEGVYVQAKAFELGDEEEITRGLKALDDRVNKNPHNPKDFMGKYPRRVYKAVPEKFWLNKDGDIDGNYVDVREEVEI